MNEQTTIFVEEILSLQADTNKVISDPTWLTIFDTNNFYECQVFDIYPMITNCALDIICDSSMGHHVDAQHNAANSKYVWAVRRHTELIVERGVWLGQSLNSEWIEIDTLFSLTLLLRMTPFIKYFSTKHIVTMRKV